MDSELETIKKYAQISEKGHGLGLEEPLVYESIVRDCFNNPHRKKFPDFLKSLGRICKFDTENDNPEYWIAKIQPEITEKFNNQKINLYDTTRLTSRFEDEQGYLEAIKSSNWCGPYVWDPYGYFYFASINYFGDNKYFVYL